MSIPCSAWEFGGAIRQQAREADAAQAVVDGFARHGGGVSADI